MSTKWLNELRWHCRRGMLELDLLLIPFFDQHFQDLTEEEKKGFEDLLAQEDQDLYDWLVKKERSHHRSFDSLIEKITSSVRR